MNKVILLGYTGRDAEVRYLPNGDAICNLSLATTERWTDKSGHKQERTEWHRLVFFGRTAEICGEYVGKGSRIAIEGSLTTRKWEDRDGNTRFTTEIRGQRMEMLETKKPGAQEQAPDPKAPAGPSKDEDFDDDIPF